MIFDDVKKVRKALTDEIQLDNGAVPHEVSLQMFLNALGFDLNDSGDVIKLGHIYTLNKDNYPIIILGLLREEIELKLETSKILNESSITNCSFVILSNMVDFKFYSKLYTRNILSTKPFFEFDIFNLTEHQLSLLNLFSKNNFDHNNIVNEFKELRLEKIQSMVNASHIYRL